MNKLIFLLLSLLIGSNAFADATNIQKLRDVGFSPEQTRQIDAIYHAGRSAGEGVFAPVVVSTPVAAVNQLAPGRNVVPPTATAGQVFIGPVEPVVGQEFDVFNPSTVTVGLKAHANMKINDLGSASEKLNVAAKCRANCFTGRAIGYNETLTPTPGTYVCSVPVCATPTP